MPRLARLPLGPLASSRAALTRVPLFTTSAAPSTSTSSASRSLLSSFSSLSLSARSPLPLSSQSQTLSLLRSSPLASPPNVGSSAAPNVFGTLQVRGFTYGREYQPSQRKRKRKHGFLARAKGGRLGRKMLARRRAKGMRFLSH